MIRGAYARKITEDWRIGGQGNLAAFGLFLSLGKGPSGKLTLENHRRRIWLGARVAILLLAVVSLSTLAKNGQYFPKSHPAHLISAASKMKAAPSQLVFEGLQVLAVATIIAPQPAEHFERRNPETPSIQAADSVSRLQDRSPPQI